MGARLRIDRALEGERRVEPSIGEDPVALLIYDGKQHFAAQFMRRDRTTDVVDEGPALTNNSRAQGGSDAEWVTRTLTWTRVG